MTEKVKICKIIVSKGAITFKLFYIYFSIWLKIVFFVVQYDPSDFKKDKKLLLKYRVIDS